ncbi:MAG: phosphodiester glycosidase family protein, partial [Clostridia bacterium]|nr:phosphodiester glycosidase family protein [Clostridia bacterium]
TVKTLQKYMQYKGCIQAFNLDGGASAVMYYKNGIYSKLTSSGERSLYDIIYFATAEGMQSVE